MTQGTKNICLALLSLFFYSLVQAQSFNWVKNMNLGGESPKAIAVDASGNVCTVGNFGGTVDQDPGPGVFNLAENGNGDVYINKLDASGNFIWAKSFGGTLIDAAHSMALDAAGNIHISGGFQGTVDFDPGPGVYTLTALGYRDIFVVKLNASGTFLWAKRMGGVSAYNDAYGIALDAAGNVYTAGNFDYTTDFDPGPSAYNLTPLWNGSYDIFVSKLDAAGSFVWAKSMGGGGSDYGYAMTVDPAGNVYTTGSFESIADFDPGVGTYTLTSSGSRDIYISKLTTSGNFVWAQRIGGNSNSEAGLALALDPAGNLYSSGMFTGSIDCDPGPGSYILSSSGSTDMYIHKMNASGNFVWAKSIGGSGNMQPVRIVVDAYSGVYTTGNFYGTVDFNPGTSVYSQSSDGLTDIFINKLDTAGNFDWAGRIGGFNYDASAAMTLDVNGNIYMAGTFADTVDFDPGPGIHTVAYTVPDYVYILKLCKASNISTSGATSLCQGGSIVLISSQAGSYLWNTGATTQTISVFAAGVYSVQVVSAMSCSLSSIPITVSVNPLPVITVNSGSICLGQSYVLQPGGAATYTISGGQAVVSPTVNSTYTVTGTSGAGCTSSLAAIAGVSVHPNPTVTATSNMSLICTGEAAELIAAGGSAYSWSSGGAGITETVMPLITTTYIVTGSDINGCSDTALVTQLVDACTGIRKLSQGPEEFNLYPNPATSGVFLEMKNSESVTIQVRNAIGQLLLEEKLQGEMLSFSIAQFPVGIYWIQVKDVEGARSMKLVKE